MAMGQSENAMKQEGRVMATEAGLRRRMRKLRKEINSLHQEQEAFRQETARQMDEQVARFRNEYQTALHRLQNETEEMYARRLRKFQEQTIQQAHRQYRQLQMQAEEAARQQSEKLAQLSESNEELRQLFNRMKQSTEETEAIHREKAASLLGQVEQCRKEADSVPHEFFYDGEYAIIDSHAGEILGEIKQKMYQAAAADAGGVIMEFDLLKVKVEQALHEWLLAFQDYSRIVKELGCRIKALEGQELQTAAGTFKMAVPELDFWSSGTYIPFKEKVAGALAQIRSIEEKGVVPYLKEEKQLSRKGIFTSVQEAQKWGDELSGIINCIISERALSDERWALARDAAKILEGTGYTQVKKRFRPKGEENTVQNPLDCLDLVETIQGTDRLWVIFIPVREHGVAVRNECIITLEAHTLQDCALAEEIIMINKERLQAACAAVKVTGIVSGTGQGQRVMEEEHSKKKQPSPQEQIRYMERKYH